MGVVRNPSIRGGLTRCDHLPVGRLLLHQGLIDATLSADRADRFSEYSIFRSRGNRAERPAEVVAYLIVPSGAGARTAAKAAMAAGFATEIQVSGGQWVVTATSAMPRDEDLADLDALFEQISRDVSGTYEGHEVVFESLD